MKFWVVGATGFLGSHLVQNLVQRGHEIIAASARGGQASGVQVAALNMLDVDRVAESARGADGAFVVAGKVTRNPDSSEELHELHVRGTRHVLEGLRRAGVRRV